MSIGSKPISSAPVSSDPETGIPILNLSEIMVFAGADNIQPFVDNFSSTLVGVGALGAFGQGFEVGDTIELAGAVTTDQITSFVSTMRMASSIDTAYSNAQVNLADAIALLDEAQIEHALIIAETLGLAGSADFEHLQVLAFVSSMGLLGDLTLNGEFVTNFAAALSLKSLATFGRDLELTDVADLIAVFDRRYQAVMDVASTADLIATFDSEQELGMVFVSVMDMTETMDTLAELGIDLIDALEGKVLFKLGDDIYQGWVFNTEHRAFSEYTNYPFNSIVEFRGTPLGASEDGIYQLEGADDAGTAIDAAVKTKMTSLRERMLKEVDCVYIGYTSDGQMVLKTTVERNGERQEFWYAEKHGVSSHLRTGRFNVQRGLRSTYWQFELVNKDGADFELEDVTILYEVLSRRIR